MQVATGWYSLAIHLTFVASEPRDRHVATTKVLNSSAVLLAISMQPLGQIRWQLSQLVSQS